MNTIRIGALKRDDGLIQLTFTKAGPHEDPIVLDEDGKPSHVGFTGALFCPFCGTALGREHIPFETERRGGEPLPEGSKRG